VRRIPAILFFLSLLAGSWGDSFDVEYQAKVSGIRDGDVEKSIKEATQTFLLQNHPPATLGQLRHRTEKDLERIEQILESFGYYDGEVEVEIDTDREPHLVRFQIEPGEAYRFRSVQLEFVGGESAQLSKVETRLRTNERVIAAKVYEEQQYLLESMREHGYPFPTLIRRKVSVDRKRHKVDLSLVFDPGEAAVYGDFVLEGLETIKPQFIRRKRMWKEGDPFDVKELAAFESELLGSGLFSSARVEALRPEEAGTGTVPIRIRVVERDQRTIRVGASYSDVGPGGRLQWEHRNLVGGGERLENTAKWSEVEVGLKSRFERPGFLGYNQSLLLDVEVIRERPDAYHADKVTGSSVVERYFNRQWRGGFGVRYKYSRVEQFEGDKRFSHLIFPLYFVADYRNDSLNPEAGIYLHGGTAYYEDLGGEAPFLKSKMSGRVYGMMWERARLSLAGRVTVGAIEGTSIEHVPADERFYAGGGGSIRGYEYQHVGPFLDGVPVGGSHLLEFSLETRLQPGKKLGYVLFLDGGTVYNDLADDADRSLRYGAGVGLRWFTTIGPLRADLAYPLNPSESQVERVQFYISLGQSF
jgi:translocation and assembly module TamA